MPRVNATILVVDDEIHNRRLLQAALESKGYYPQLVDSGQAAIEYIRDGQVDLVLMDIVMPQMDGYETLNALRQRYTRTSLPVIMVTAMSSSEDITRALELGANDYITKPIDIEVMHARIHTQLSLKQTRQALEKSIERFDLAVQGTSDGIWDWDLETSEVYYSPRWKAILGYAAHQVQNTTREWFDRVHPEDSSRLEDALTAHLQGRKPKLECEYRMIHKDGSYRWVLTRGTALVKKDGTAYRLVGGQTDITHNKLYDPQTGLYSRSLFEDKLSQALKLCSKNGVARGAVLLLGLEQFGSVRTSLGDLLEDQLLMRIGKRLKRCIGLDDCLARIGADSFALLLINPASAEEVTDVVFKIREALVRPFAFNDLEVLLHNGIGIVMLNTTYLDSKEVVRNAFAALDEAKRKGKDQEAFFDNKLHQESIESLRTEAEMRKGIKLGEFVLHYQPIISIKERRVVSCEALIRWNHPRRGFIGPGAFISQAEQTGLVLEVGDWVLQEACRQSRAWLDQGLPLSVSVNFSAQQFHQKNMVSRIINILEITNLPPHFLKIELTESALIEDIDRTISKLNELRDRGIRISLDDFGTGYSSLSYLKKFPIDILKIDQSFIRDVTTEAKDASITRAIIQLAHSLNLDTIAEGVETAEHLEFLQSIGCELFQGYFFSRPLKADIFTEQLCEGTFLAKIHL